MQKACYLVTGGCGFIGSHLCDALHRQGHTVLALDNFSNGKRENINGTATIIAGDILDKKLMIDLMQKVDGCFHLAAITSVELSNRDWLATHEINLIGTLNVFDCARKVKNFNKNVPVIFASSAAVYGDNNNIPLNENELATPLTAYGADKRSCELHARVATDIHHVPTIGLRFFNVYGSRQDPHSPYSGVISIFKDDIQHNKTLPIYGDGEQSRDFVHVSDVVDCLIKAMNHHNKQAQFYNVCTGKCTTIKELAHLFAKAANKKCELEFLPKRNGDIVFSSGDPTLARKELDFVAKVKLAQGITQLLNEKS
jgi:UDP-glucose 4-epimerase